MTVQQFLDEAEKTIKLSAECQASFGKPFLDSWIAKRVTYCAPDKSLPLQSGQSKIECFPRTDLSVPLTLCVTTNAYIPQSNFINHLNSKDHIFQKDSFRVGQCSRHKATIPDEVFGTTPKHWFVSALKVENQTTWTERRCDNIVSHPVYFMDRYDTTNLFHASEDMITTFISLALLQQLPDVTNSFNESGVEIVIVDSFLPGYYMEFWRRLGQRYRVRFMATDPFPENSCFSKTIHNVHGGVSLLSIFSVGDTTICPSMLHQAYSAWFRNMFSELGQHGPNRIPDSSKGSNVPSLQNKGTQVHKITFTTRSRYEHSHELGGWQQSRVLRNEEEIIMAIQKKILEWNSKQCIYIDSFRNCKSVQTFFTFEVAEFSDMQLTEQLELTLETSILVGVHGAALAHALFMQPQHTALIEIKPPPQQGQFHFHNIATWNKLFYDAILMLDEGMVDIKKLMDSLGKAMNFIQVQDANI